MLRLLFAAMLRSFRERPMFEPISLIVAQLVIRSEAIVNVYDYSCPIRSPTIGYTTNLRAFAG